MTDLTPGVHEFIPTEFLELVQQYDQFSITIGETSFMQIRVPTKWAKVERDKFGDTYFTCRNKRKRDGHLFVIYGDKFIFDYECRPDRLDGKLKTNLGDCEFDVSMWKTNDKKEE